MFNIPPLSSVPTVTVCMCVLTVVMFNLLHSRSGRAIMAIREVVMSAESIGINPTKWKCAALLLGAATAAMCGSYYASYCQTMSPGDLCIKYSISLCIMFVLGGVGSKSGTLLAAMFLGEFDTVCQNFGTCRMVITACACICCMVFKPSGHLGH